MVIFFIPFFFTIEKNVVETISELVYTPKNERDYGTLACWGKNSIGKQAEPCVFQVVPAGNFFYIKSNNAIFFLLGFFIYVLYYRE